MTVITRDENVRGGEPVITGTRFPLSRFLAELAEGRSLVDIADDFSLNRNTLAQALQEAGGELLSEANVYQPGYRLGPKRINVSCCAECPLTEGEDATYLTPGWKHCIPADRRLPQPIPRNERPVWCPLPIFVTAEE